MSAILAKNGFIYIKKDIIPHEKYAKMKNIEAYTGNKKFTPYSFSIYSETRVNGTIYIKFPRRLGINLMKEYKIPLGKNMMLPGKAFTDKITTNVKLYDYQQDAVNTFIEKKKAGSFGGLLILSTGAGKTITSIEIARNIGMKCLIIVKVKSLAKQWKEEILKNYDNVTVNIISGIPLKTAYKYIEESSFCICVIKSIYSNKFKSEDFTPFGTVIIDEVHGILAEKTLNMFNYISRSFIIGITATPKVKTGLHYLLDWYIGPILFEIDKSYKGELPIVHMIKYKPSTAEIKEKYCKIIKFRVGLGVEGELDPTTTDINTTVNNKERYHIPMLKKCLANTEYKRIIVLCKYRKLIDNIYEELNEPDLVGKFYSETNKIGLYEQGETLANKKMILSVLALGKESLNIIDCNCLIILNCPKVNKDIEGNWNTQAMDQVVGRCLRKKHEKSPHIYIINDGFAYYNRHYIDRLMYFNDIKKYKVLNNY